MDGRHRFILQRLKDGFQIEKATVIEQFLSQERIHSQLNDFFNGHLGLPTLTFFYQPPPHREDSEGNVVASSAPQLFLNSSSKQRITSKAIYFVRTNPKGVSTTNTEQDVCYGEIPADPLGDFNFLLGQVFRPLLTTQEDWGQTADPDRAEFIEGMHRLHDVLDEAVSYLAEGCRLQTPDPSVIANIDLKPKSLEKAALDDDVLRECCSTMESWCKQVSALIEKDDQDAMERANEGPDVGPRSELEYWRHRSQKFSTIIDQLKSRECKIVLGVLREAKVSNPQAHKQLSDWRFYDNAMTDAANEAKDNVKYLTTLDKYTQPLYDGTPHLIIETLPGLLNNIRMIQQIARYYNTSDRIATLLVKVSNQMIQTCKRYIVEESPGEPVKLWDQDFTEIIKKMESALRLYQAFQENYRVAKDKMQLLTTGGSEARHFDFSENAIFGRFELFCKRLQKLIDMFTTIYQFNSLANNMVEGMQDLIQRFLDIVKEFKLKPYDLLDFQRNQFDRDYLEFNVAIHDLETSLQGFINTSFETIPSTEQALKLLQRFQSILQRDNLRADLDNKYMVIFHNYGLDLDAVQRTYEKFKHGPPMVRNLPPVSGNITWCRQLLRRIEEPMKKFQKNRAIMSTKESKKIIRTYNKVARALIEFETLWHEAWAKSVEKARSGLSATLIIQNPTKPWPCLCVNFDHEIFQLSRETRCLMGMNVEVPDEARMVLMQDEKFKQYYNHLAYTLKEYERVTGRVNPVMKPLLEQHLEDLNNKILPGLQTLTWTSMNIDAYLTRIHGSLSRLEDLLQKLSDVLENRVDSSLKFISRTMLVDLPEDQFPFNVTDFVNIQEQYVKDQTTVMDMKNLEVERAVYDLIELVDSTPVDSNTPMNPQVREDLINHYYRLMYHAILTSMKNSFNLIKKRVGRASGKGLLAMMDASQQEKPFFTVNVQLDLNQSNNEVVARPTLDEIQDAINRTAIAILRSTKRLISWGQDRSRDDADSFFDMLAAEKEVCKLVLLLTGSIEYAKKEVLDYLVSFSELSYLWKDDMQSKYKQFMTTNPTLADFDEELTKYMQQQSLIRDIPDEKIIGVLGLNNTDIKETLIGFAEMWMNQFSKNLLEIARKELETLMDYMKTTTLKFSVEVRETNKSTSLKSQS